MSCVLYNSIGQLEPVSLDDILSHMRDKFQTIVDTIINMNLNKSHFNAAILRNYRDRFVVGNNTRCFAS